MHCNGWEIAFTQESIELSRADGTLDKNDDLVVRQVIEDLVKEPVLPKVSNGLRVAELEFSITFSSSDKRLEYCCKPCRVSFVSSST
jgi:hypothetical protein